MLPAVEQPVMFCYPTPFIVWRSNPYQSASLSFEHVTPIPFKKVGAWLGFSGCGLKRTFPVMLELARQSACS